MDHEPINTFDPDGARDEPLDWRRAAAWGAGACVLVGLLESVNAYVLRILDGAPRSVAYTLREQMPWWMLWMIFVPGVFWLARRFRFDDSASRRSVGVHLSAAVVIALAHGSLFAWLVRPSQAMPSPLPTVGAEIRYFLLRYLFMDIMTYGTAVGVYYSFEYFSRFRRSARAAESSRARATRLQLNLAEARLHALRMELNPHFLFNTLNAVSGLVRKRDHDAAVDMLARLGELLRTTLDRDMPSEVPLGRELELLRRFVEIEQVRFGDRLRVVWDVESEVRDALVPPLVLQPLVENALKHGIGRRPGTALLRISARRAGDQLELAVRDTGDGLSLVNGRFPAEGIGLRNTRARLEELYGHDGASVELTDVAGGGARASLRMPYHVSPPLRAHDVAVGA